MDVISGNEKECQPSTASFNQCCRSESTSTHSTSPNVPYYSHQPLATDEWTTNLNKVYSGVKLGSP